MQPLSLRQKQQIPKLHHQTVRALHIPILLPFDSIMLFASDSLG
jgi:hypothetical protein